MILEGVSSLRKEFRDYVSLSFFVDTPKELCLQRGLDRDKSTGKTPEELINIWTKWLEEEETYIQRDNPREYADVVIDGTKPIQDQIG
jgi:uridine kinase